MAATGQTWHLMTVVAHALSPHSPLAVFAAVADLTVPNGVIGRGDVGEMMAAVPALALALVVAAIVALTVKPREPLVRLLALLLLVGGAQVTLAPLAARGFWVAAACEAVARGLGVSLFARFCLVCAGRAERAGASDPPWYPWYRALERWGPLIPLVLCLPAAALVAGPLWLRGVAGDTLDVGLAAGLALGLAGLAWSASQTREGSERAQLLVVTLGAALAGLPPLGLSVLPALLLNRALVPYPQTAYGLLALPICLAFARVHWRTVSLLSLIDRVSVYVVLALVLLAGYGALALGLAQLEGAPVGSVTTLVSLAVAVIAATTFAPLRDRIQRAVDTVLYRDYYDLGPTVQRFSQSLATVREQTAVMISLLDDLCDTLNLSGAALIQLPGGLDPAMLRLLEPDDLVARRDYTSSEVRQQLVQALAAWDPGNPQAASREPVHLSPFASVPGCAALVVVGPGSSDDTIALLLIGSKRGGGRLRAEDRALLGTVAHQAATALENATLIGGLRTTLSQLRRSTEQLEDARAEQQLLLREMVDADERQRASLARDIHDVALQDLMYVSRSSAYCVSLCESLMARAAEHSPDAQRLAKELAELTKVAASAETELRNVLTGLYPAMIESLGLPGALETLAEEVSPGHALAVTVECDPEAERLADELEKGVRLHLYRIAQEAIRNASKHTDARQVAIELRVTDEPQRSGPAGHIEHPGRQDEHAALVLTISDDGAGIALPIDYVGLLRDRHLGLASMRDRAERVGGQLSIRRGAQGGTRIEVRLRLRESALAPSGWATTQAEQAEQAEQAPAAVGDGAGVEPPSIAVTGEAAVRSSGSREG